MDFSGGIASSLCEAEAVCSDNWFFQWFIGFAECAVPLRGYFLFGPKLNLPGPKATTISKPPMMAKFFMN